MKKLNDDIKNKKFESVYLLCGSESYFIKNCKDRLVKAVCGDDTMNYHHFDGKGSDCREVISLAETMPFFSPYRMIVLEDTGWFKSGGGSDLVEFLPDIPDTTCLLFVESEVDKRNRLYKAVKEHGYICEIGKQREDVLVKWILTRLTKAGKKITRSTMDYFLGKVGTDMQMIHEELEKLISYVGERDVIRPEDIDAICTPQSGIRVFDLVDAISERNQKKALDQYHDLIENREPAGRILYLLGRQFHLMLQVKGLQREGAGKEEIASKLGIQSFVASKTMRQAGFFQEKTLLRALESCVETEEAIKTGRLEDTIGIELLLIRYTKTDK